MEDNFYKASSKRLFKEPVSQTKRAQKDKMDYERERPLITSVMKILEAEISFREKIDSVAKLDDPEACIREIAVNKQVCDILRRQLGLIKMKVNMYDKKKLR